MRQCLYCSALLLGTFVAASAQDTDEKHSPSATLARAEKALREGKPWTASVLFRQASESRDDRLARRAFARLIEIDESLGQFGRLVGDGRRYLHLLKDRRDIPVRIEVRVRIGLAYEALAQYRLAEKELLGVLPDLDRVQLPVLRLLALGRLARIASLIHDPTLAQRRWREAERAAAGVFERKDVTLEQRIECVWVLAECYFHQKRHEAALERLQALLVELQKSKQVVAAQVETLRQLSRHHVALGKPSRGADTLQQALRLLEKHPSPNPLIRADALGALGDAREAAKQPREAADARTEAVAGYQEVIKSKDLASAFARGQAFWKLQRIYQQTHQYQRALLLIGDLTGGQTRTDVMRADPRVRARHGALKSFLGAYREARQHLRDALPDLQSAEVLDLSELPRLLLSLAVAEQATDNLAEADRLSRRCLDLYRKHQLPDDETLVETYNLLGSNAALQGEFAQGVEWFRQGAARCARVTPAADRLHCTLLLNQALLHKAQGDLIEATKRCLQALQAYQRSVGNDRLGVALFQCALASLLAEQNKHAEASKLAADVLVECQRHDITGGPLLQTAQHCRALGHLQAGELDQAEKLWQGLRHAQEKAEQRLLLPCTLNYLGVINELRGKPKAALTCYNQADALQRKQPRAVPSTRCVTLWRHANLLDRQGEHGRARTTLLEALAVVERARQSTYGDSQQRTSFLTQFVPIFEQAFTWTLRDGRAEEAFNLAARVRSRAFLDQLLMAGVDPRASVPGSTGELLRKREKELLQRITRLRAHLALAPADTADEKRSRELAAELETGQEEYASVWREILNASTIYRSLADEETIQRPLKAARQKVLRPGTAMLAYHLQRDRAYAMLVAGPRADPEIFELKLPVDLLTELKRPMPTASPLANDVQRRGMAIVRRDAAPPLPASDTLPTGTREVGLNQGAAWQLVEHYRCLLESPSFGTTRGLAVEGVPEYQRKALEGLPDYARVLLPTALRRRLETVAPEVLFVVPDGPLHKLPLEALLVEGGAKPVFVLDRLPPMIYSPSVSGLVHLASRSVATTKGEPSLLSLSDPAYPVGNKEKKRVSGIPPLLAGQLPRLPFTAEEAKRIKRLFPPERVTALDGERATEEEVSKALTRHSVLHLAAHGYADKAFGNLFGAIALVPPKTENARPENDGFLTLLEIYRLNLTQCELAVLSACETNVGPQRPLESGLTLASGFLAAGARRVVASHWSVDDRSTAELMATFFEQVRSAESPATYPLALQKAKKKLRERPETASPFHWAPFVLLSARE